MKIVLGLLIAVALLGACDEEGGGSFEDAEAVVEAMQENGIECEDLETTSELGPDVDADVSQRGFCFVGENSIVISMFENAADRDRWVEAGGLAGEVAVGDNWVAGSDSQQLVEKIGEELDAKIIAGSDDQED